jgi:hypothetical protein
MPPKEALLPISIKIAIGFWMLFMVLQAIGLVTVVASGKTSAAALVLGVLIFVGLGYQSFAASRLSRWSLVCHSLVYACISLRRYMANPRWTDDYPLLGVFVDVIPWALITILVAIHWRRMTWKPLGESLSKFSAG